MFVIVIHVVQCMTSGKIMMATIKPHYNDTLITLALHHPWHMLHATYVVHPSAYNQINVMPIKDDGFNGPAEIHTFAGLLFDMDGTIVDSTDAIVKHWHK